MVNNRLLNEELKNFDVKMKVKMKSIKYNKDLFPNLFKKFNEFGMVEFSFCCYGLEQSCWAEVVEEGNWNLTLEEVKHQILINLKECKKFLYNGRKYGANRLYIGEKDGVCYIYIYLRDILSMDYSIWFANN